MRKASLISGIVAVSFTFLGALLKMISFPGGSFLMMIGAFLFLFIFSPLLLIYQLRQASPAIKKLADVAGIVVAFTLGSGLLMATMRWPGWMFTAAFGVIVAVLFLVLFFLSAGKMPGFKPFGIFSYLVIIFYTLLLFGAQNGFVTGEESKEKMARFNDRMITLNSMVAPTENAVQETLGDSALYESAVTLHANTSTMIGFVEQVKAELIAHDNGTMPGQDRAIAHPLGYDVTTHYLVGIDPHHPTGKGVELFRELKKFRENNLNADISFPESFDTSAEQWATDKFYHVPLADVLTQLTDTEIALLKAEQEAIRKRSFVKP